MFKSNKSILFPIVASQISSFSILLETEEMTIQKQHLTSLPMSLSIVWKTAINTGHNQKEVNVQSGEEWTPAGPGKHSKWKLALSTWVRVKMSGSNGDKRSKSVIVWETIKKECVHVHHKLVQWFIQAWKLVCCGFLYDFPMESYREEQQDANGKKLLWGRCQRKQVYGRKTGGWCHIVVKTLIFICLCTFGCMAYESQWILLRLKKKTKKM